MSNLVTIFGGSGFVGRYIARRMAREGWRVRVACRNPNDAIFVRPYGTPGQVEPVFCNVRDDASVRAAMAGAGAVVNCVGILNALGKNSFDAVQAEAPGRIARIAAEQGVTRLVHISAIGADAQADSNYARTKGDGFFNRFAGMTRFGPILPVVGGNTKFQPVFVDDVAAAAVKGVLGQASGTYELGGPDVDTFKGLMGRMLAVVKRKRLVVNKPFFAARILAGGLDFVQFLTGGLIKNSILTGDQVKNLRNDNIVSPDAKGFADLGIQPTAMEAILPEYLWRYRPSGQYLAIKESAKNLKA
jgi:uncharacterized protein YbjT (DUF2867 family)